MENNQTDKVEVSTSDLIALSDELSRVKAYYECTYLAVNDSCTLESANAIQSVMLRAHDKLDDIIARVGILYGSPMASKKAQQKKKAA